MKIEITGGSGFVGRNLIPYLEKIHTIITHNLREKKKITISNDVDVVIHLAGKAHDLKNTNNIKDYYQVNFELTKQVYNAFLNSNAKIFIFVSSIKAVADTNVEELTENVQTNPITHYGISKKNAEEYILNENTPSNKKFFILRPTMIHGPGNKGNLNLLYKIVNIGIPWPLGIFENNRSFCSIENLCFVIKNIIEKDTIESGVYNVCDDEKITTNELIKLISSIKNKKIKILRIPKKIIFGIAKFGDYLKLPLNTERLNKLTDNFTVDNSKIKKAIKIDKMPISAIEGLKTTLKSF